jgi:LDH2 family malate/lactate/ureidoglycolate dehydrogenase
MLSGGVNIFNFQFSIRDMEIARPKKNSMQALIKEPRAKTKEQRQKIVIHGTRNTERGTQNAERGTRNVEHGTWNTERGTRNTEHGTILKHENKVKFLGADTNFKNLEYLCAEIKK